MTYDISRATFALEWRHDQDGQPTRNRGYDAVPRILEAEHGEQRHARDTPMQRGVEAGIAHLLKPGIRVRWRNPRIINGLSEYRDIITARHRRGDGSPSMWLDLLDSGGILKQ